MAHHRGAAAPASDLRYPRGVPKIGYSGWGTRRRMLIVTAGRGSWFNASRYAMKNKAFAVIGLVICGMSAPLSSWAQVPAAGEMGWHAQPFQEAEAGDGGLFSTETTFVVSLGVGFGYAWGCKHWGFDGNEGDEAIGAPCTTEATLVGLGTFLTMTAVRLLTDEEEDSEARHLAAVLRPSILPGAMEIGLRLPMTF